LDLHVQHVDGLRKKNNALDVGSVNAFKTFYNPRSNRSGILEYTIINML